jgi:hypothetical protein
MHLQISDSILKSSGVGSWHLNSEVGFCCAYVPLFYIITGIFTLPTERLVMKWFVRKPTTDSPRLLSLSPLRCGAEATDDLGEPACYRQSSACSDLSPHRHHQRRSRIGESIYRRESMWYYKRGSQTSRHIKYQSFHHYIWFWFSSARALLCLPTDLFPNFIPITVCIPLHFTSPCCEPHVQHPLLWLYISRIPFILELFPILTHSSFS